VSDLNFIFYDTETTGINPYFDQILQFAAIKTDENFNELDRFNIRCQLLPHVVPHPNAMLVTGVTADMLTDTSLPTHYEMMSEVRKKLEELSPGIFIGYNSLRFDEAMLRSAFYQTLHSIYLTNSHGNGRTDALLLAQASTVFAPGLLKIPTKDNGKPTFKLDQLAPANGFAHDNAHDALADVEATIFITKKIAEEAPELWRRLRNAAEKKTVVDFIKCTDAFLLTEFFFNKGHSRFVSPIGTNPYNPSEYLAVSLDDNVDDLIIATDDELEGLLTSTPRPIRRIRANASPLITSLEKAFSYKQFDLPEIEVLQQRIAVVQENTAFKKRVVQMMADIQGPYEDDEEAEVEEKMYFGFYSKVDEMLLSEFHEKPWRDRLAIIDQFEDERLHELGMRLLYFHKPEALSEEDKRGFIKAIADRYETDLIEPPWLTPEAAMDALEALTSDVSNKEESDLLDGLRVNIGGKVCHEAA